MAKLARRLTRRMLGISPDAKSEGYRRSLKGLREGDYREVSIGLALAAISYLRQTKPRRQLIYRREIPEGSALIIHHKKSGKPKLEIRRP